MLTSYNSRNSQPISSIKERVQSRVKGHYGSCHMHKTLTYYQLHLEEIVFLQRWFRKRLVAQNRKLQTLVLAKVSQREQLRKVNQELLGKFGDKQEERTYLMGMDHGECVQEVQFKLREKVRKVVQGTLENADQLAQNNGRAKYALSEIRVNKNQSEQLEGEIEGLKFQLECHEKRKGEWRQKLAQLRKAVQEETLLSKQIETRLDKVGSKSRNEQHQ